MNSTAIKGILDFEAKQQLLVDLELDRSSNFAAFLVKTHTLYNSQKGFAEGDKRRIKNESLRQASQKWYPHRKKPVTPEGKYVMYWDWIIRERIGLERVTAHDFFAMTFVEFVVALREGLPEEAVSVEAVLRIRSNPKSRLPEHELEELKRFVDGSVRPVPSREFGRVDTPLDAQFEGMQTGISAGHVHPWHCFLTPEAACQWNSLVENGNYAMYSACLASLEELCRTGDWKAAVANGSYNVGVALAGGGSPEKDVLLLGALAAATTQKVQYWLVDVSPEMIHHSQRVIARTLGRSEYRALAQKLHSAVVGCRTNILELPLYFHRPTEWTSVVWSILGGTIGNIPESRFFDSVSAPSKRGDLLIVGCDTHDRETWRAFQERIRTQYQGEEVYDLLLEGRRGRDRKVEIKFRKASDGDIPGSWIVDFRGQCDNKTVVVTSTRYELKEFLKYALSKGWEHVHTVVASESTFRQVLLRRI